LLLINLCAFKQIIGAISKKNILDTTYSIFKSYYKYYTLIVFFNLKDLYAALANFKAI